MTDDHLRDALLRRTGRRGFLRGALGLSAGGAAIYALGCGSDGDAAAKTATAAPPADATIEPNLLTNEFVAGQDNRFAVGLLDAKQHLVKDHAVHARFFSVGDDGVTGTLRGEGDMSLIELNVEGAHVHDSSGAEIEGEDSIAFYVVNVPFPEAGRWGAEIAVTPDAGGAAVTVRVPFAVGAKAVSPGLGETPPASRNDTTATNTDARSLCTREPICPLHDKVIADVLGKGRPLVVQFSTPAFCATRFCGPVLEVLLAQAPQYEDRIDFVHIEIWRDHEQQILREAVDEWKLPGEPYTFFIDKTGKIAGKLEAVFSEEELAGALANLVKL